MTYVRAGLPPILSIQGDADPIVPYSQNTRLRDALTKAGHANELVTIPGGGHGNFNAAAADAGVREDSRVPHEERVGFAGSYVLEAVTVREVRLTPDDSRTTSTSTR